MYDYRRFGYVIVRIDKKDYCRETLIDNLLDWEHRLGRVDDEKSICFKGLLPMKGIRHLETLKAISPYGAGYDITVDGFDIYEPQRRINMLCG